MGILSPDYNLGIGSGTHGHQTDEMLKGIEAILLKEKPDVVMVYGWNVLVGTDVERIVSAARNFQPSTKHGEVFGSGACERIAGILCEVN